MTSILVKALQRIEQMSDPGSYEKAIIEMKSIATNALALYTQSEKESRFKKPTDQQVVKAAKEILHLHMCEQEGLQLPTKEMWFDAVNNLSEALSLYSQSKEGEPVKVDLGDSGHVCYSSLKDKSIPIQWHQLWHEIEVWYGDVSKRESAEELVRRLQKIFQSKENEGKQAGVEEITELTEALTKARNFNSDLLERYNKSQDELQEIKTTGSFEENDMLRSCLAIIERRGARTNWEAAEKKLRWVLARHNPYASKSIQSGERGEVERLHDFLRDIDLITDYADFDEVAKYKMIEEVINSYNKTIKT